jgi:hypothetical protein
LTDAGSLPDLGPLHPVARLGRVLQQLRSLGTLHTGELASTADELEAAGQTELAAKLRVFRDLQARELGLILDELADLRTEMETAARSGAVQSTATPAPQPDRPPSASAAAADSPKRARWLAEQARRAERPVSRRDFFTRPDRG